MAGKGKRKKSNSTNNYIDNKLFLEKLLEHRRAYDYAKSKDLIPPQVSDELSTIFFLLSQNISNAPNFMKYTYREDMVLDGVANCIKSVLNFKTEEGEKPRNPFCYFTTVIWQAFVRRIKAEKRAQVCTYTSFESHFSGDNDIYHSSSSKLEGFFNENIFKVVPMTIPQDSQLAFTRQYMLEYVDQFEKANEAKIKEKKIKKEILQEIDFATLLEES